MSKRGVRETRTLEECEALHETELAVLVMLADGAEQWVPKSVIDEDESDIQGAGDSGSLVVHEWWAESEGL